MKPEFITLFLTRINLTLGIATLIPSSAASICVAEAQKTKIGSQILTLDPSYRKRPSRLLIGRHLLFNSLKYALKCWTTDNLMRKSNFYS